MVTNSIFLGITIGIIATTGKTLFLMAIGQVGGVKLDLIRIIGSFFSRDARVAQRIGFLIHYLAGTAFCGIYLYILNRIPTPCNHVSPSFLYIGCGAFIGFAHGVIVALTLIMQVSEFHPRKKIREIGLGVAAYYLLAHIVYGLIVGILYAAQLRLF